VFGWPLRSRSTLYILLPLALVLALAQVSQGVVQNFSAHEAVPLLQATAEADGKAVTEQLLPMGPAASQIAIKQLGTNGGGFFNVNSAHPFENPTPLSNFLEMLAILLIAAALCHTFGTMVQDTRQGWAVLAAMTVVFVAMLALCMWSEYHGNPRIAALGVDVTASSQQPGGGALTTFSIANDVAKYFAIIPAAFASTYPALGTLNVMGLATPESAILAAVIFNALIIIALIPLALHGVRYRAVPAPVLLRDNLLIYGLGGIVAPFLGIKAVDAALVALGLA
jgi:hypothetical protein